MIEWGSHYSRWMKLPWLTASARHKIDLRSDNSCFYTTFDVVPFDVDVFVPIGSRLLVPEAQNVDELVLNDAAFHACRRQTHVPVAVIMRSADWTLASLAGIKPNVFLACSERVKNPNILWCVSFRFVGR